MGRRFGQHFLTDPNYLRKLKEAICTATIEPVIVEIGAGKGALTEQILGCAEKIVAYEIDSELAEQLRAKAVNWPQVEIIVGDFLKADLSQWGQVTVVGNIPYYITSPVIEHLLHQWKHIKRIVLTVQREVAERITAAPGSRIYGYLSAVVQFYCQTHLLFTIPPTAFSPPPKVYSAAIELIPQNPSYRWGIQNPEGFIRFVSFCFSQKRKKLRNNLAGIYGREIVDQLAEKDLRAEELSVRQLVELYQKLEESVPAA